MKENATAQITGSSALEIADSIRSLTERNALRPGDALPPVRGLADALHVNRNTVIAAYRQLSQSGIITSRGRAGTRIAERAAVAQEGFAPDSVLRDIGTGNPDPDLIPDLTPALASLAGRPVLYGEPVIDPDLEMWAREWMSDGLAPGQPMQLTITGGAVDAVERLLAQALHRDDSVALEDPSFLSIMHTVQLGGYRAVPVPVDAEGMTVEGLTAALAAGVRAVVCTPRAQNPTGASLSQRRAAALRAVLAEHPYVLVIEDDHFSMLSTQPYQSVVSADHRRWARVRSVSKFLGPDMCLAVAASDPHTAAQLATRLSPGTTWVSHLLQRLTLALVTSAEARAKIDAAAAHYSQRNASVAALLADHGVEASAGDGLNVWVSLTAPARDVADQLMRRGWLPRTGDEFVLVDDAARTHLRLTVHDLSDDDAALLAADLASAISAVTGRGMIER